MMRNTEKEQKKQTGRIALLRSIAAVAVVLALIIGLTYAWFFNQSNIATLVTVAPPTQIAIRGANGQELSELDLSYTDSDVTTDEDGNKHVTIQRVISVKNEGEEHKLEIVHTTNMKGLTFTLYPATAVDSTTENTAGTGGTTVTDSGFSYTYNRDNAVKGRYINSSTPESSNGYKYANDTYHTNNYDSYKKVQAHAEPLYWIVDELQKATRASDTDSDASEQTECLTYYILEISWTETDKETDIFYVLAQNA